MSLFKFFSSSEETFIKRATKNDPIGIQQSVVKELKEYQNNIVKFHNLISTIFAQLNKKLMPYEYTKLIIILYCCLRMNDNNYILSNLVTHTSKVSNHLPDRFPSEIERQIVNVFAAHIDNCALFYNNTNTTIYEKVNSSTLIEGYSDNDAFDSIDLLQSTFVNLANLDWKNRGLYRSKLIISLIRIIIKELTAVFYKLSKYILCLMKYSIDSPLTKINQIRKLLLSYDDAQKKYFEIINNADIHDNFPDCPTTLIESTQQMSELLELKYDIMIGKKSLNDVKDRYTKMDDLNNHILMVNQNFDLIVGNNMHNIVYFTIFCCDENEDMIISRSLSNNSRKVSVSKTETESCDSVDSELFEKKRTPCREHKDISVTIVKQKDKQSSGIKQNELSQSQTDISIQKNKRLCVKSAQYNSTTELDLNFFA